jgi:opacity protein-like surface antigen
MRLIRTAFVCVCIGLGATFACPPPASAFGLTGLGGKLGFMAPENLDGTMVVGGHLEFEQHGSRVHLVPGLMYWKSNNVSDLAANADLYYHFSPEGVITPYVGAGLGLNFLSNERSSDSTTKLGANLFGGLRIPAANLHYFFEGRYTASDLSQFALLAGVTFHTGGGH